jgi:hypothetical protein
MTRIASEAFHKNRPDSDLEPLPLLSIVIPAQNEEGCISSTVEHLYVELRLQGVPHEILIVDDASHRLDVSEIATIA